MTKVYSKILLMKSSGSNFIFLPVFYLIMWVMKSSKNFGKIVILKIWELISLGGAKTHFGKLVVMHFQAWKQNILTLILSLLFIQFFPRTKSIVKQEVGVITKRKNNFVMFLWMISFQNIIFWPKNLTYLSLKLFNMYNSKKGGPP